MSIRFALFLLLLCASLPLAAHEVRMLSAAGDGGGCHDSAAAQDDDINPAAPSAQPATHATKPAKAKPVVRQSGDNLGDIRPPRWHSFLPGMFR